MYDIYIYIYKCVFVCGILNAYACMQVGIPIWEADPRFHLTKELEKKKIHFNKTWIV